MLWSVPISLKIKWMHNSREQPKFYKKLSNQNQNAKMKHLTSKRSSEKVLKESSEFSSDHLQKICLNILSGLKNFKQQVVVHNNISYITGFLHNLSRLNHHSISFLKTSKMDWMTVCFTIRESCTLRFHNVSIRWENLKGRFINHDSRTPYEWKKKVPISKYLNFATTGRMQKIKVKIIFQFFCFLLSGNLVWVFTRNLL